jgi:hypothetical protein
MNVRERGWGGMDWIHLAQEPVEGVYDHGNEPWGTLKFWEIVE